MPTISLRLTDEEHMALKDWAHGSHRSMQREAVYRIFEERSLSERVAVIPGDRASEEQRSSATDAVAPRYAARSESDFKPDFK